MAAEVKGLHLKTTWKGNTIISDGFLPNPASVRSWATQQDKDGTPDVWKDSDGRLYGPLEPLDGDEVWFVYLNGNLEFPEGSVDITRLGETKTLQLEHMTHRMRLKRWYKIAEFYASFGWPFTGCLTFSWFLGTAGVPRRNHKPTMRVWVVLPLWDSTNNYPRVWDMMIAPAKEGFEPKVFTNKDEAHKYYDSVCAEEDGYDSDDVNKQTHMFEGEFVDGTFVKSASKK